jgi:hypothetical protein
LPNPSDLDFVRAARLAVYVVPVEGQFLFHDTAARVYRIDRG